MRILNDCLITHENSEVIKEYGFTKNNKEYHVGIDIKAKNVYCPCKGVVIQQCLFDSLPSVIVQYSEHISLRFTHFKEVYVREGQLIESGELLGNADSFVHFEYLTVEENVPSYCVRLSSGYTLWKHDPMLILAGNIIFDQSEAYGGDMMLWGETYEELSNNRGE